MANPFGLPKVILAEREARRRRRLQLGVYTVLIAIVVLLVAALVQGCQSQRQSSADTVTARPAMLGNRNTPNRSKYVLPASETSDESAMETDWISPTSTSLPENVTLPAPAPTSAPQAIITTPPPEPVKAFRQTAPRHHVSGVYVVKSGDTLTRIARTHGTTVKALKTANHLKSDRIFVGEKLKMSQTNPVAAKAA